MRTWDALYIRIAISRYTSFGVGLDLVLPEGWPHSCREPRRLPFCPDYRTHKSSSSHNSSDTPKHPKYHRSVNGRVRVMTLDSSLELVDRPFLRELFSR